MLENRIDVLQRICFFLVFICSVLGDRATVCVSVFWERFKHTSGSDSSFLTHLLKKRLNDVADLRIYSLISCFFLLLTFLKELIIVC